VIGNRIHFFPKFKPSKRIGLHLGCRSLIWLGWIPGWGISSPFWDGLLDKGFLWSLY
jgi:hypothetical protein